jgi:outer membrane protein, adhesin transport system
MIKNIFRHLTACRKFIPIMCLAPFVASGQVLSLHDAVDKSITNYPLLQQRKAEVSAGRAHVTTVKGNSLPSLLLQDQFDIGTNNSIQGSYLTFGIIPSTPGVNNSSLQNNRPNANNLAVSFLQWELYNFGYHKAQQKEAGAQLAVNEAIYGGDKYLLTQSVTSLYLDWLKKFRLLRIQDENRTRLGVMLKAIRATVISGLKPGVDSSTASAAYSDAQISYLQVLNEFNYDRISMSTYTGEDLTNVIPDSSFISPAFLQGQVQASYPDSIPGDHPLLNVFEKQYEQQLASNSAISKKYMPKVGLDGVTWLRNSGISYAGVYPDNITDGIPYSKYNYFLGATLSYNLFDLKHRHDQLAEGRFAADARKSAMQSEQLALNKMMQQANSSYATTLEKLKEIPVQLVSARQAYGQQMALYRSGLNTLIEVTNAQYALLQAETNYVLTQDELLQLLSIRAALGGQFDNFLQNFKR